MPSDTPTVSISRLGRYEILGRIATGGMATVYLARLGAAGGFAREFALKVVHPHLAQDDTSRARFFEEARLASRVRHPNAVRTIDVGEDQGYRYLVLELIDGVNLRQLMLHRGRPLSHVQAATIVAQVARGLGAVHDATDENGRSLGMVHRDLAPHNIMVDREGRAIVIDLGLAKADAREITQVGVMCGRLPYMSPEQARLDPLTAASDIFSLGTVLFELCTGELPFGEDHTTETLEAIQSCDSVEIARRLAEHNVPSWLMDVTLVCLCRDADDRFGSADELAEALSQELARQGLDEANVRRNLASVVADAMPDLGTTEALDRSEALRPRIEAISEPRRIVPEPEPRTRSGARWMAAGIAFAALTAMAVIAAHGLRLRDFGTRAGTRAAGILASDQAASSSSRKPTVSAPTPTSDPNATAEPSPADAPDPAMRGDDAVPPAADAKSRPNKGRRRHHGHERDSLLKPNPYTDP